MTLRFIQVEMSAVFHSYPGPNVMSDNMRPRTAAKSISFSIFKKLRPYTIKSMPQRTRCGDAPGRQEPPQQHSDIYCRPHPDNLHAITRRVALNGFKPRPPFQEEEPARIAATLLTFCLPETNLNQK